ncbi:MAG: RNA polymerase subunit sigma-70 [Oscillospiraceae bacterium]|nr:RNA polymerase subunit sigma-70 [Oscillospiraceae bacterium]
MQNWQRVRNYRKIGNSDGSITYIIIVNGKDVEVSEEVFTAYSQADRRERYQTEREAGRLLSLDQMDEDDVLLTYLSSEHAESAEDAAIRRLFTEESITALDSLEADERRLIQAVVMDGLSERDYAASIGLSQKGVNKRKQKILEKLRKMVLKQS